MLRQSRDMGIAPTPSLANTRWFSMLVLIGVIAFGLRWFYVAHAMVIQPIRGDAIQYHAYAWNLAHHWIFSQAPPHSHVVTPDSFRDPGYPLFLAIWLKLFPDFGSWYPIVLMVQAALGASTVMLLVASARFWLPARWLFAAGLLMAVWPHSITITSFLLSETLFGFLCALGFYLLSQALRRAGVGWAMGAGLAFGAAAMTNAVMIPFASLLAVALFWQKAVNRRLLLALMLSSLVLPAAWSIRNVRLPSHDASSTGRALLNFVQGSWPEYHPAWRAAAIEGDPKAKQTLQAIQHEESVLQTSLGAGFSLIAHRFGARPLHYLAWYLHKPFAFWGWSIQIGQGDVYVYPTLRSPFDDLLPFRLLASICEAINPVLMLLALGGCIVIFRRYQHAAPFASSVALLSLYVTTVYSILQSEPRYSIPFRGIEILLAIYACWQMTAWLRAARQQTTAGRVINKRA